MTNAYFEGDFDRELAALEADAFLTHGHPVTVEEPMGDEYARHLRRQQAAQGITEIAPIIPSGMEFTYAPAKLDVGSSAMSPAEHQAVVIGQ